MTARTRSNRIQTLVKMALRGHNYSNIFNKAMSWGISDSTARSYMKNVSAILLQSHKTSILRQDKSVRINPYDPEETIIGSGSEIIKS